MHPVLGHSMVIVDDLVHETWTINHARVLGSTACKLLFRIGDRPGFGARKAGMLTNDPATCIACLARMFTE